MENNKFEYSYCAPTEEERREIDSIRKQYQPQEKNESKLARLRALDRKVKRTAEVIAVTIGIVGALLLGVGMCITMKIIAEQLFVLGVISGIIGIALCVSDYFIYRAVLKSRKKKYGDEIFKLSEELLGGAEDKR